MGKVSLNSVINEKFLSRLAAAGQQGSSAPTNPFKSGGSSVSLSGTLRLGAQTYAAAVGGLNNTLSLVNIAEGTLAQLGAITDKMIDLADQAARKPLGPQGRRSLDIKFRELAEDFRTIIDKSEFGGANFLSSDGLAELLVKVGLDRDSSASIAAIFEKFSIPEDDNAFASERVKGVRPLVIPASAFSTKPSKDEYQLKRVTDFNLTTSESGISTTTAVFATEDTFLNQNPGLNAVFTVSDTGTLTSQPVNALQGNSVTLLAVNEATGYSVGVSSGELIAGENSLYVPQLFLFDESGGIVGQLTTNTSSDVTYTSADMTTSDERFVVTSFNALLNFSSVDLLDIAKGVKSTEGVFTNIDSISTPGESIGGARIDNSGEFVIFNRFDGFTNTLNLYEVNTAMFDDSITSDDPLQYGFVRPGGEIVFMRSAVIGQPEKQIVAYGFRGVEDVINAVFISEGFVTLEGSEDLGGYYAFVANTGGARTAEVYSTFEDVTLYKFALGNDAVSAISAAFNVDDPTRVDLGIVGALPDLVGDADTELYRIAYNPAFATGLKLKDDSAEYTEILDPARGLTSRPAAYRVLNDLKALREQITTNVDALRNVFEVVAQNIELVRATGLALLEIGDSLTNETDAAAVAESLRRRIREQVPQALAQAENLDPIAVATLTYSGSGN